MGLSIRKIAIAIGKNASTVSREIRRNTGLRGYRINQADRKAIERRSNASRSAKKMTENLKQIICEKLLLGWSPEQIAGRLKFSGTFISHESIYRWIWRDKRSGGALYTHLRHHGKRYNKRSFVNSGRGFIPDRVDITERPAIVETKSRTGDWEGDTIIGAKHKGAIVSYVERKSKFTLLKKIERKTAHLVTQATIEKMSHLPHPILTITYDNGKEFSGHKDIASALNAHCYFATPYRSWERGLNEHTNGLVRQYLPKKTCLDVITDDEVQMIENSLNHRPRKVLQYKTPFEVFFSDSNFNQGVALRC